MFTAQGTRYYGVHAGAVHNKSIIVYLILPNVTHLIGRIYALACGTRVNTKPTDSQYSPVLNEECNF